MREMRLAVKALAILGSVVVGLFVLLEPALADNQYDWGVNPALTGEYPGTLVEVHQGSDGVGPLWYRTGHVSAPCCPEIALVQWDDSSQYDIGMNPAVAMGGGFVVEVHQGSNGVGPLWYRVGSFVIFPGANHPVLWWSASHQYDFGAFPAVAVSGTRVVEVHQATSGAGSLWYRTGQIQSANGVLAIAWNNSINYDTGAHPAVSLFPDPDPSGGTTTVAEVHQAGDGVGPLLYLGGTVHDYYSFPQGYISWAGPTNRNYTCGVSANGQYDIGMRPAIAITAYGVGGPQPSHTLAELHQFADGVGSLP